VCPRTVFEDCGNGRAGHCNGRVISSSKARPRNEFQHLHNPTPILGRRILLFRCLRCLDSLFVWHVRISAGTPLLGVMKILDPSPGVPWENSTQIRVAPAGPADRKTNPITESRSAEAGVRAPPGDSYSLNSDRKESSSIWLSGASQ
jgi:hypothetical protein